VACVCVCVCVMCYVAQSGVYQSPTQVQVCGGTQARHSLEGGAARSLCLHHHVSPGPVPQCRQGPAYCVSRVCVCWCQVHTCCSWQVCVWCVSGAALSHQERGGSPCGLQKGGTWPRQQVPRRLAKSWCAGHAARHGAGLYGPAHGRMVVRAAGRGVAETWDKSAGGKCGCGASPVWCGWCLVCGSVDCPFPLCDAADLQQASAPVGLLLARECAVWNGGGSGASCGRQGQGVGGTCHRQGVPTQPKSWCVSVWVCGCPCDAPGCTHARGDAGWTAAAFARQLQRCAAAAPHFRTLCGLAIRLQLCPLP
jgi:hypothetical protein